MVVWKGDAMARCVYISISAQHARLRRDKMEVEVPFATCASDTSMASRIHASGYHDNAIDTTPLLSVYRRLEAPQLTREA